MRRRPSSGTTAGEVDRQLDDTAYDNVVVVKNAITAVNTVADSITNGQITTIITNLPEILLSDDNAVIATTKANEASVSAAAAAVSELSTASMLDQFDDRYLGSKAVEPALDNDGNALLVGALYFDTAMNKMRVYGSDLLWSDALTLTAGSISTMTNKTIDDISNTVGANHVHYKVRNASGSTIAAGTVLSASGTQPGTDYIQVVPVTNPQTQIVIGIAHTTLLNNGTGLAINTGVHDAFNTSAWTVGTILYPNSSGGLTSTKPTSGVYQTCAYVLRQHATQGTLLVEFTEPKNIASTTQSGYVQLNDTLTSTSTTLALTAAQGKALQDGKQPIDATLTALAGVTTAADKIIYATGVDTFTTGTLTAFGRSLIDDVDAATARTTLGISATNTPSTAVGGISATNVQGALQELESEKMSTADYLTAVGTINNPLLYMPLMSDIDLHKGVGTSTFTRASTATYIDRYGVLKSAAIDEPRFEKEGYLNEGASMNLLTYSEQFDNGACVKSNVSVVTNTVVTTDPYGTNLAEALTESTATGFIYAYYDNITALANSYYTYSVFVKARERTRYGLAIRDLATSANQARVTFNLSSGAIEIPASAVGTYTNASATIVSISNGWFRVSLTAQIGSNTSIRVNNYLLDGVATASSPAYTGDGTSGLYVFGAQLEALPFASSYIPTVGASVTRSADILSCTLKNNSPKGTFAKTIMVDFLPKSLSASEGRIFDLQSINYNMIRLMSGQVQSFYGANTMTAYVPSTVNKTRWAYVVNNDIQDLSTNSISNYANGVLINTSVSGAVAQSEVLPASTICIGQSQLSNGFGVFNGYITNIRIYDRVLTAQEVALA